MKCLLFILAFFSLSTACFSQSGSGRIAVSRIQKGKWNAAEEVLRKSLRKDSANAEIRYIFSWYFAAAENPHASIDSAYHYAVGALRDYSVTPLKEKERLRRFPIDSNVLIRQRAIVDSLAFERAKQVNTAGSYEAFLLTFKTASQRQTAIELRDEVSFVDAMKLNTWPAFLSYLEQHPESPRAAEARQRYEKLLYEDKTRDGKLVSYQAFYTGWPLSAWRLQAEKNIFEISTASGRPESFLAFIKNYPSSVYSARARAILDHLNKEEESDAAVLSDSLQKIQRDEKGFWVPVLKNGKFGFIDQSGTEMIRTTLDSVRHDYLCGNIRTDYLMVSGGIMNRAGQWIAKGVFGDVSDLGEGFLKITAGDCAWPVHKSGGTLTHHCYEDVKIIARNYLSFRENGKWGLLSLAERVVIDPTYDDISALDTLVIFGKNGKKIISTIGQVAAVTNKAPFNTSWVFDDIRRMAEGVYLVRNGVLEGVVNQNLEFVIPLGRQTITRSPAGFVLEANQQYRVTGLTGISDETQFDKVRFYGRWASLRTGKNIRLYNLERKRTEKETPDSLWFNHQMAFARLRDSVKVFINATATISFEASDRVTFMSSPDSSRYFFVADKKKKTVFNAITGKRLFSFTGEAIEYMGQKHFMFIKTGKRGILASDGKVVVPPEYAAIAVTSDGWVSLLKDKKFGMYNVLSHRLIKPVYDRNIIPFSPKLLIAYKPTGYGFIDVESKPAGNFEFEEVRKWNEKEALVRKNFLWMIYNIQTHQFGISDIREYRLIQGSSQEDIAIARRGNYYGVISNSRGEFIPAKFTDIINLGSSEEPLYFTEKNVEEAGIHVIIYYDKNGKLIRKQALEDEEFERIICE